ncbi:MAG: T9SS type A sorting domain-containing protein [Ignavibacteriaceae bacterium]|nr:T9SS type A sorting domain-containing protein [Ignavibacteriaceae bacterium]
MKRIFFLLSIAVVFGFLTFKNYGFDILPVQLIYFYAVNQDNGVLLKWGTATEVNNYGFDVERAQDTPTAFIYIDFVPGSGNSNSPKHYSLLDTSAILGNHYFYRLKQINTDGTYEYSDTIEVNYVLNLERENSPVPETYSLFQNYPNPFNPSTKIKFQLPEPSDLKLLLFNSQGELIKELLVQYLDAGSYIFDFNAGTISSGVYFITFTSKNYTQTIKALLLK